MEDDSSYDLMLAVEEGDADKVSALIATRSLSYFDASSGYIFLCEALSKNHTKIAKILLEHRSRVNSRTKCKTNTPLHFAVKNKNVEVVAMLLDRGANVNATNHSEETPLHLAIKENDLKIVSLLLNKNARVNAPNNSGKTPLYYAIVEGNVEIMELLRSNNARTHACSTGMDVLHIAARVGTTKIVEHLLNNGAFVDIPCERNGYTPLHCAVAKCREEIVKLLLKRGADINARTKDQSTALHIAAEMESDEIVKVLLEHDGVDIDAQDDKGRTVLNVALEEGNLRTIKNILDICPQVNNEKNRNFIFDYMHRSHWKAIGSSFLKILFSHSLGIHPLDAGDRELLHTAIKEGYAKIVEDLLRYGADVDSPYMQKKGCTLLRTATINGKLDIAETLIKHGANVNAIDETGSSPISYAIARTDVKMTKLLVSNGAKIRFNPDVLQRGVNSDSKKIIEIMLNHDVDCDIMAKDKYGQTALGHVIAYADLENNEKSEDLSRIKRDLAELLLSRAKVDARNEVGESLLHIAARDGGDDVVEILLRYNANVNFATKINRQTPLHYSAIECNERITRMLLKAGAASNAEDKIGRTPLHYACKHECNEKVVAALLKFRAEIDHEDSDYCTPLHIAARNGRRKIVEILLKSFADVECTDEYGKTALHVASERGWSKVVKELLDYSADPIVTCKRGLSPFEFAIHEYNYYSAEDDFHESSDEDDFHDSFDDDSSLRGENVTIADTIKQQIIKIKSLDIYDRERSLESVELNDAFGDFQAKCEREVGLMKSEKIGETNISYYNVLTKSMNQLAMLARNKDIVEVLESFGYREKFPIFYKMLYYKFKKGQRRENLLNPSLKSFNFLSKFPLPELVSLQVLDELSYKELENLIKAAPEIESR